MTAPISARNLLLAFASAATFLTSFPPVRAGDFSPEVPPVSSQPFGGGAAGASSSRVEDDDEAARRLHAAKSVGALYQHPTAYLALKNLDENFSAATLDAEEKAMNKRKFDDDLVRNTPTVNAESVTPLEEITGQGVRSSETIISRDKAEKELAAQRESHDSQLRAAMAQGDASSDVARIARKYTDLAFDVHNGHVPTAEEEKKLQFYEDILKAVPAMPQNVGNLRMMIDSDEQLPRTLAAADFTEREINDIKNGKKTIDEIDYPEAKKTLQSNLRIMISAQFKAVYDLAAQKADSEKQPISIRDLDRARADDERRLSDTAKPLTAKERNKTEAHRDRMQEGIQQLRQADFTAKVRKVGDYGGIIFGTAALFRHSPDMQKTATAFNAGLNITDAIGRMAIKGAIDPSGLSAVIAGLGIITSLFGPQEEDATTAMLKEVLRMQREMLVLLQGIDHKVDILDVKLNEVLAKLDSLSVTDRAAYAQVSQALVRMSAEIEDRENANTRALLQGEVLRNAKRSVQLLTGAYPEAAYQVCLSAWDQCTWQGRAFFDEMHDRTQALRQVIDEAVMTAPYVIPKDLPIRDEYALHLELDAPLENRMGQLPGSAIFLKQMLEAHKVSATLKDALFAQLPNPYALLNEFIPAYSANITHLPAFYAREGNRDIERTQGQLDRLKAASQEMRDQIDTARRVAVSAAAESVAATNTKVYSLAMQFHLAASIDQFPLPDNILGETDEKLEKLHEIPAFAALTPVKPLRARGILPGGTDEIAIGYAVAKLNNHDFVGISTAMGALEDSTETGPVSNAGHFFPPFLQRTTTWVVRPTASAEIAVLK